MLFSSSRRLPPAEWLTTKSEVEDLARKLEWWNAPYGFDTETNGLGYDIGDGEQAGDGLGSYLEAVSLAFDGRRIGVDVGSALRHNLDVLAPALFHTQKWMVGYNFVFDANVFESNTDFRMPLTEFYLDGMGLFQHWDESAEDTDGQRGLKPRAKFYLGMPVSSFDEFIHRGGFRAALNDKQLSSRVKNYTSKDSWMHLGLGALGMKIASRLPWGFACPKCGTTCYLASPDRKGYSLCFDCGEVERGRETTVWDWHRSLDVPFLILIKNMQQRGVPLNAAKMEEWQAPVARALVTLRAQFQREISDAIVARGGAPVEISPSSPAQIAKAYFRDKDATGMVVGLGLPLVGKTETGTPATGAKALALLATKHDPPGINALRKYKKAHKINSAFVLAWPKHVNKATGCLHPRLRPEAQTSRLTCKGPNAQQAKRDSLAVELPALMDKPASSAEELSALWNIPLAQALEELASPSYSSQTLEVEVRRCVEAPPGYVCLVRDYAQLEVRITALESQDPVLISVVNKGLDMHAYTASLAYASHVPGLVYDDIEEAKKCKEGQPLDRALRLLFADSAEIDRRLASAPQGDRHALGQSILSFQQHLTELAFQAGIPLEALRKCLDKTERSKSEEEELRELVNRFVDLLTDEQVLRILALMGYQDKKLLNFRQAAKNAIFGIIYGIGAVGLAAQISDATGEPCSLEEAKELIESIKYETYPGIGEMIERFHNSIAQYGYVRTYSGRYRHPAGVSSGDNATRSRAKRQGGNSPIQGEAAMIMQRVMLGLETDARWRALKAEVRLQIHDELLSTAPLEAATEAMEIKRFYMEERHGVINPPVPFLTSGDIASNWGEAK